MNLTEQIALIKANNNKPSAMNEALFKNINFLQKNGGGGRGSDSYDVRVSSPKESGTLISFEKDRCKGLMITGYGVVAVVGDLLMFKQSDSFYGWKFTHMNESRRPQILISGQPVLSELAKKNCGKYKIHYDAASELYYINAAEKDVY